MKFGIFEHMDDSGVPLSEQIASRMQLAEDYDRLGFYAYHLAEHHGTPLGLAPSPGIFMAALAQRTRRLRFGPLVYLLPLYHPLRLIEEVCMLDQMSGGRLELGVGRGVSPFEVGFYGVDPANGPRQFPKVLRCIKLGLTSDRLTFEGEFYRFTDVPMVLKPVQKPHPPLWYGLNTPDATQWAAKEQANIATLVPAPHARRVIDRFREEWAKNGHSAAPEPLAGIIRHMVLAETEAEARTVAERAYRRWYHHLAYLWTQRGLALLASSMAVRPMSIRSPMLSAPRLSQRPSKLVPLGRTKRSRSRRVKGRANEAHSVAPVFRPRNPCLPRFFDRTCAGGSGSDPARLQLLLMLKPHRSSSSGSQRKWHARARATRECRPEAACVPVEPRKRLMPDPVAVIIAAGQQCATAATQAGGARLH